jgi:hypothetical protein
MSNRAEAESTPQSEPETKRNNETLTLSSKGLGNVLWSNYENDFEFEVCGEHYFCPSFVAEFLSPHISKLRRSDCTIRKLVISTKNSSKYVERFLSLGFGFPFCLKSEDYLIVRSLCLELENVESYRTEASVRAQS